MSDFEIAQLSRRIAELEHRVSQLDGGGATVPPPPATTDPQVAQYVREGNLIGGIKRYRELTGVGLAEAKNAGRSAARPHLKVLKDQRPEGRRPPTLTR